jgi:Lysozyme like domain
MIIVRYLSNGGMPMENIKEKFSDVVHHWTAIGILVIFLFSGQDNIIPTASALTVKPEISKTEAQLKKETLEKFSNTVYKPSEALTDKDLVKLLSYVGFEGNALKMAWAVAKKESHGRPMAYNGNRNTGDSSYGIFQINMLGNLGDDRKEKFNLDSNYTLFDPVINAEITYYMTNGGKDWSSWKGLTPETKKWLLEFPKS